MMRLVLTAFCALSFLSCSSRHICIDIEEYPGLEENTHYRLIIDTPNVSNSTDTVYWQNSKKYKLGLKESACDEYLAFVEVSKQDETGEYGQRLFRSVAAIDGNHITIKAFKKDSIILSGSKSNEYITNFWNGKMAEFSDDNILNDFFQNEIRNHPADLYGSFTYSLECLRQMMDSGEDLSLSVKADMLLKEIQHSDSYIYNHCVICPFLEVVIKAGDVSPFLVNEFISYMCPF